MKMISKQPIRIYTTLFWLIILFAIIISCSREAKQTSRPAGGPATSVEAAIIKPQPIEYKIFTTGTLLANEEVELRPETSGRITGVFFEEGKKVEKGDLLLKINDQELQAQLKRKQLEQSFAADDENRKRTLLDKNAISQEEYDKALNTLNMIKAEREVIESQIAKTSITAPFNGTIGLRYISEGSYITPGTLVATMQNIDPIKVEFAVPEKYAPQISRGTPISIQVSDTQERYAGVVYAVEAKIDPATRTLKARATIPNPETRLIPGLFAKVEIILQRIPDAIMIPAEALVPELNNQKVFICENGKARSISVKTGIRTDRDIQITEGLNPDDTLIITGLLQLSDGKPVEIKGAKAE